MNANQQVVFQIAPSSGTPIYRQVIDQVRRLVVSGRLKAGDELPSVRMLAKELAVNPMTLSKAYSLLEAEGLLSRRRGKGMVVAEQEDDTDGLEQRTALLRPTLEEAALQARQLRLNNRQVLDLFQRILEREP